ncbi:MAG: response regulator transcription factor [Anaerolineales bacterium]|jgi:CheY-like chemotaxis protein
MKILLADDNPEVRSALRLLLEQEPIQAMVMEVTDTQSLLAQLSETCPTVVLLDWELPRLHNSDFLMKVRNCCPETRVIALSSKFEARQAARAAGVDAFISKAEPPEQILSTLCSFLPEQRSE